MKLRSMAVMALLGALTLGLGACRKGAEEKAAVEVHNQVDKAIDAAAAARETNAKVEAEKARAKAQEAARAQKEVSDARARDQAARDAVKH